MSYSLYAGWQYSGESKGMLRQGDTFTSSGNESDALVCDFEYLYNGTIQASHYPYPATGWTEATYQAPTWPQFCLARWEYPSLSRKTVMKNCVRDDGSGKTLVSSGINDSNFFQGNGGCGAGWSYVMSLVPKK